MFSQKIKKHYVFLSFRIRRKRKYRFLQLKWKRRPKKVEKALCFLTFQITRERKYRFLHLKLKKLGTAGELPDPSDPRHGAWCTTPGTLAPEVRMTVVLNKLPQMTTMMIMRAPQRQHVFPMPDRLSLRLSTLVPLSHLPCVCSNNKCMTLNTHNF